MKNNIQKAENMTENSELLDLVALMGEDAEELKQRYPEMYVMAQEICSHIAGVITLSDATHI